MVYNLPWAPPPEAMDTTLDLLLEASLQKLHKNHLVVVPHLNKFLWIKQTGKDEDILFTVTVRMVFWGLREH